MTRTRERIGLSCRPNRAYAGRATELAHDLEAHTGAGERVLVFLEAKGSADRLGALLTESSHPKTATLSQTIQRDVAEGIRMLLSVDAEIAPAAARVFGSDEFERLVAEDGSTRTSHRARRRAATSATSAVSTTLRPFVT